MSRTGRPSRTAVRTLAAALAVAVAGCGSDDTTEAEIEQWWNDYWRCTYDPPGSELPSNHDQVRVECQVKVFGRK